MIITAHTDIGMRKDNQDSYWAARFLAGSPEGEPVSAVRNMNNLPSGVSHGAVICICDGMGGLSDGARASQTAASYIREVIMGELEDGTINEDAIENAMLRANADLKKSSTTAKVGTTCTIFIAVDGEYRIFHVGDSRCYKVNRDNTYKVLTTDHTAYQRYTQRHDLRRKNGEFFLKGERIDKSIVRKFRSSLTRCLGVKERTQVDIYEGFYEPGEIFLVASDGFWHRLTADPRWTMDLRRNFHEEHFKGLVRTFKNRGEKDNLTVAAVQV